MGGVGTGGPLEGKRERERGEWSGRGCREFTIVLVLWGQRMALIAAEKAQQVPKHVPTECDFITLYWYSPLGCKTK